MKQRFARVTAWHFHWRFWKPKRATGGQVYFGWWAEILTIEGEVLHYDESQVAVKRDMGLLS